MNAILEERIRQGKTQKRLAHEAGIAARTLRKLERGEEVSLETMGAVRKALGIRVVSPNSASVDALRATLLDEERVYSGLWGKIWPRYSVPINLSLLALCAVMVIAVLYMAVDMTLYDVKRNAILEVTVDGSCSAYKSQVTSRAVEDTLLGTQVLRDEAHEGTDGCVVKLHLHTEEKQAAAVEKLRAKALHATFLGFRE